MRNPILFQGYIKKTGLLAILSIFPHRTWSIGYHMDPSSNKSLFGKYVCKNVSILKEFINSTNYISNLCWLDKVVRNHCQCLTTVVLQCLRQRSGDLPRRSPGFSSVGFSGVLLSVVLLRSRRDSRVAAWTTGPSCGPGITWSLFIRTPEPRCSSARTMSWCSQYVGHLGVVFLLFFLFFDFQSWALDLKQGQLTEFDLVFLTDQ